MKNIGTEPRVICSFLNPHLIKQQPETDDGGNASNASGIPGTDKDAAAAAAAADAESFPAEVWMRRPGGGIQIRGPAYATLTERVRQGNDLVSESDTLLCDPRCTESTL